MNFIKIVIWCAFVNPFRVLVWSSTTSRWKLTFYSHVKKSWSDGVRLCSNDNAHLLTLDVEKNNALLHFVNNQWKNYWKNKDVWIGLFMQSGIYKWQENCTDVSTTTEWSNWKQRKGFFQNENKLCTLADGKTLEWKSEHCDGEHYQICEEMIGTCTFEDVTEIGKCAQNRSDKEVVVQSSEECKQKCLTLEEAGKSCWSVTFDFDSNKCYPSFSNDPFAFETLISCPLNASVSIRRCFEGIINDEPFPVVENQRTDTTALHTTNNDVTTVLATTTNQVTTVLHSTTNHLTTVVHTTDHLTTASDDTTHTTAITKYQKATDQSMPTTQTNEETTVTDDSSQLSTESQKEQTTNSVSYRTTDIDCCYCSKQHNLTKKELEERIKHLKQLLKVDKRSTSKAKRKRECAEDNRPTSRAIGWSGALLIAIVPLLFVIADVLNLKKILESNHYLSKTNYRRRKSYVTS